RTGIRAELLRREIERDSTPLLIALGEAGDRLWLHRDVVRNVRKRTMEFLARYFETNRMSLGVPKGELVQKILSSDVDAAVAGYVMSDLANEKIIRADGDLVDVPGRSKDLGGVEGELARMIEKRFRDAELKVPPVSELIQTIPQKPKVIEGVVSFLVKRGALVRLAEGIYLHRDVLENAKGRILAHRGETIDVAWFKDFFGLSRKVAIPLLEFFDQAGVTKRVGDRRQIL
ncbi:MAG TPA: SelB C-terminal domain-containing protein, partial [Thermoanaerobaculia bacterium]